MSLHLGVAGTQPGQRQLNGPQTTGREYRNLSQPQFEIDDSMMNVRVPMRDGVELLVDIYRPRAQRRSPTLFAASPYPRQIQNSGAPMGFVEAGATDFFVPRGYAHAIVNVRGTGGSGGTYDAFGPAERHDMHDLVEWLAAQSWCDGNVGGIGISAFAVAQFEAAVERPPHLRAIFAPLATVDPYEAFYHGGVTSINFGVSWIEGVAKMANLDDGFLRGALVGLAAEVLRSPRVHAKLAHFNGEAALGGLKLLMRGALHPPFSSLLNGCFVEHQVKDEFWQARNMLPMLAGIDIPVYVGSDWQNVPLHLPSTFLAYDGLKEGTPKRMALLGEYGMAWPWESLHVEALAWFDRWLCGRETGIMDGPPIRYVIPGEPGEPWHDAAAWPPPEAKIQSLALRADGTLASDEGCAGTCDYTYVHPTLRAIIKRDETALAWTSAPLDADLRLAGPVEVLLDAASTGGDTAFMLLLQDVAPDATAVDVTAGCRRAAISDDFTQLGGVPAGEQRRYRIRLVDNARYFAKGHCIRLTLRGSDESGPAPMMGFKHAPVGASTRVTVASSSRLTLSVLPT